MTVFSNLQICRIASFSVQSFILHYSTDNSLHNMRTHRKENEVTHLEYSADSYRKDKGGNYIQY